MPASIAIRIAATAALLFALAHFSSAGESITRAEVQHAIADKMSALLWSTRQEQLEGLGLPVGDLEILVEELASKTAKCVLNSFLIQARLQKIDEQGLLKFLLGLESASETNVENSLNFDAVKERIRGCNETIERDYGFALG